MKHDKSLIVTTICILSFYIGFAQNNQNFKHTQDTILKEMRSVKPWYEFGNDKITIIPMVVMAMDATYYSQDDNSYTQVGDQSSRYEPGQIRAVRFGLLGTLNFDKPWRYIIAGAYKAFNQGFNADSATDFMLYDLRLDIPTKFGSFAFGKLKEPISMQRNASLLFLGGFERGMNLDGFLPARNTGLIYYKLFWDKKIYFAAGCFKSISPKNKVSWKESNNVAVGRVTLNPFVGANKDYDLHVGFGTRYSDFKNGVNLRQHPEAYFASNFVETGDVEGENIIVLNYEFAYRYKNLLLTSELLT